MFLIGAVILFREARNGRRGGGRVRGASTPPGPAATPSGAQGGRRQLPGAVRRRVGRPLAAADALPRREVRRPGQRVHRRPRRAARGQRPGGASWAGCCSTTSSCAPCTTSAAASACSCSRSPSTSCWPDHTRWTLPVSGRQGSARGRGELHSERCACPSSTDSPTTRSTGSRTPGPSSPCRPTGRRSGRRPRPTRPTSCCPVRCRYAATARRSPGSAPARSSARSAIVNHSLRTASIVSLSKLEVLHFTSDAVRKLCDEVPAFREALDRTAQERLGA